MRKPFKGTLPVRETTLSYVEPMTDSERKEMEEKDLQQWLDRTLSQLIYRAYFDNKFAKKLCEETSRLAQGNSELVTIIRKFAVLRSGRFPPTSPAWPEHLLYKYAYLMGTLEIKNYRKREEAAIDDLIQGHINFTGREITYESMQNQISKAIKTEDINEIPDWVQDVINERKKRGEPFKRSKHHIKNKSF